MLVYIDRREGRVRFSILHWKEGMRHNPSAWENVSYSYYIEAIRSDVLIPYREGDRYSVLTYRPGLLWFANNWIEGKAPYWRNESTVKADSIINYIGTKLARKLKEEQWQISLHGRGECGIK